MGTNFYLKEKPDCPTCGRPHEALHIGKSSAGWCFALRVYPERGINNLEDWKALFSTGVIENEYGEAITPDGMLGRIVERSWPGRVPERHVGDEVTTGEGTWDYINYEFS